MVALALLLYIAIRQLFAGASCVRAAVTVGVRPARSASACWLLEPVFDDIGNGDLLVFFVGMVGICIFVRRADRLQLRHLDRRATSISPATIPLSVIISQMDQGMSSIELLAVPMFIVLGLLLEMTGIATALVDLPDRPGRQSARRPVLRRWSARCI